MTVKISNETQRDLICLCGLCSHDCMDKNCLFNIIIDKPNPEEELHKRILSLMKKEILLNTKKGKNGKTSPKDKR